MSLLQYARRLYSLDTLDTRFTSSSKSPLKQPDPVEPSTKEAETIFRPDDGGRAGSNKNEASPSLWGTPEFYLYYLVVLVCLPLMFKAVYDVSKCM